MGKYRKKPVVIEAVHYVGEGNVEPAGQVPEWMWEALEEDVLFPTNGTDPMVIRTAEGNMIAAPGDWIIRGVKGEIYPCKPDIFEATYEAVEEATANG